MLYTDLSLPLPFKLYLTVTKCWSIFYCDTNIYYLIPISRVSKFEFDVFQIRAGYGRSLYEPLLPLILGRDVSGEVAAVGNSVRSLILGQEVFGALHPTAVRGTYTDYAILAEDELIPKPDTISHVVSLYCSTLELLTSKLSIIPLYIFYCRYSDT